MNGKSGWAGGRPRGLLRGAVVAAPAPEAPSAGTAPVSGTAPASETAPVSGARQPLDQVSALASAWAPVLGRVMLGLVLIWFGFHELEHPGDWTGYVPVISETSSLALVLVLLHGWVLFMLAVALIAGIEPRGAAAVASVLMLQIVISLVVTGLSDTAARDVGVLGLAICLTGCRHQRLLLRG